MKTVNYIAFMRGINVGGRHKLPMAELKTLMTKWGYTNIITVLNSGNIVFEAPKEPIEKLELKLSTQIEKHFGFPVPVLIRTAEEIVQIIQLKVFDKIPETKDTRFYVSFLKEPPIQKLKTPWATEDGCYQILKITDQTIFSYLDVGVTQTTKGMEELERIFGKGITTRNWNTIQKVAGLLT